MTQNFYLRTLPGAPTRKSSSAERLACLAGFLVCLVVIVVSAVFMAVDIVYSDTALGIVLGFTAWQVVNYVITALTTVLALLLGRNMVALYCALQRWLLRPIPQRPRPKLPSLALTEPHYGTPYIVTRLRLGTLLFLASVAALLVPAFAPISVFLLDFKLLTRNITVTGVSCNISQMLSAFWNTTDPDAFACLATLREDTVQWAPLSSLVLSSFVSPLALNSTFGCPEGFSCSGLYGTGTVQYSGTTFTGNSSYGFGALPPAYWDNSFRLNFFDDPTMTSSSTLGVQRVAYAQASSFVCESIPANSTDLTIGNPPVDDSADPSHPRPIVQHVIASDGSCFTRNSTFVIGDYEEDRQSRFDIQACAVNDTQLHLQVVAIYESPMHIYGPDSGYAREAYVCSSPVRESLTRGVQYSPNIITVDKPPSDASLLPEATLELYATTLNSYFGLDTTDPHFPVRIGASRTQGEWAPVLRYYFDPIITSSNATEMSVESFLAAYSDALVSSLGTFFASQDVTADGANLSTFDTVTKQILRPGAPLVAGIPLLSVPVALLLAHVALWWLYRQELLALDIGDSRDLMLKTDLGDADVVKVVELCSDGEGDGATDLPLLPNFDAAKRDHSGGGGDAGSEAIAILEKDDGSAQSLLGSAETPHSNGLFDSIRLTSSVAHPPEM